MAENVIREFQLTPPILFNLTGGVDFVSPLSALNGPVEATRIFFFITAPVAFLLNVFVFASCLYIVVYHSKVVVGQNFRPTFVFIAFNAILDTYGIIVDGLIVTGALNPSIAHEAELPDEELLLKRCRAEKSLITFVGFSSLGCVVLLTLDRFLFIVRPLRYSTLVTVKRGILASLVMTTFALATTIGYTAAIEMSWDNVCAVTHVVPVGLIVFWNTVFFTTWLTMHILYGMIGVVALRHKSRTRQTTSIRMASVPEQSE